MPLETACRRRGLKVAMAFHAVSTFGLRQMPATRKPAYGGTRKATESGVGNPSFVKSARSEAGGELFSRLAKDRGERRRRTEAGARSRSFVFCALDSRQLSFIQPVYPRQLSLVAYKTPLTPAKNELLTRATSARLSRSLGVFASLWVANPRIIRNS